jgi:hypothetical protein
MGNSNAAEQGFFFLVVAYTRYDLTWYVEQMDLTNFWPATITNPGKENRFSCKHVLV